MTSGAHLQQVDGWDEPSKWRGAHRTVVCVQQSHAELQGGSSWLRQCNAVRLLKLQGLCSNFWPFLLQELKSGL